MKAIFLKSGWFVSIADLGWPFAHDLQAKAFVWGIIFFATRADAGRTAIVPTLKGLA